MEPLVIDIRKPDAPALLVDSLRQTGFAVVTHHPIPAGLVKSVQDEWLEFFDTEAKWSYLPGPGAQDGYHPLARSETALGAATPDLKEFFHWFPDGQHPKEVSEQAGELHRACAAFGTDLLAWIEGQMPTAVTEALHQPLTSMLDGSRRTLLRILRYPPAPTPPTGLTPPTPPTGLIAPTPPTGHTPPAHDHQTGALRAAAHEDINLLTVLPAATHEGLQVLDRAGSWHDVACDPGTVVVNSGDMLALATGGYYPSTKHRVLLPTGQAAGQSRMATPLFLQPADHVMLTEGVRAFDFLNARLRQIRGVELAEP